MSITVNDRLVLSVIKDPNAHLDYGLNWADWLSGDTIASSTWVVPSGITDGTKSFDNTTTTIWLSGGTVDQHYDIVNRIVTALGRTDDRTIRVTVQER